MTTQMMTVENVQSRQANSQKGPFTIYEIQLNGQLYRARKELYDRTPGLIGQTVMADVRSEQKGQWTNLYVDSLVPGMGNVPVQSFTGSEGGGWAPTATGPIPVQNMNAANAPTAPAVPTSKDITIWRQTATKVAAHLSDNEVDFWNNVDKLLWFYETGQKPLEDIPFG